MLRVLFLLYYWFIAVPLLVIATLICAITTIVLVAWPNCAFVVWVQRIWSRLFFWLFFMNMEVEGEENIVPGQSYVFVANHNSFFDCFAVYGWLPVVFKWIMKAELRKIPFVGTACKVAGHIFIERGATKQALRSLEEAKSRLHDGICVVIFPEGTRSKTGEVARFKRGAFQIASDLDLPVVPLSITGLHEVMAKGRITVTPCVKVKMKIGKPLDLKTYGENNLNAAIEDIRQIVIDGIEK